MLAMRVWCRMSPLGRDRWPRALPHLKVPLRDQLVVGGRHRGPGNAEFARKGTARGQSLIRIVDARRNLVTQRQVNAAGRAALSWAVH